jgi:hypothetical protein
MQLYLHNVNKYKYLCSPNTYILTQYIVATYINLKNPILWLQINHKSL